MKLRHNPYDVFRKSVSPAGLYARQKWLDEAESPVWKKDFYETVRALSTYHSSGGTGPRGIQETVTRLFGLHLTVRTPDAEIAADLDTLLGRIALNSKGVSVRKDPTSTAVKLRNLPFIDSRPDSFIIAATLFLATIFDRGNDPAVISLFEWLQSKGIADRGLWFDSASTHNIFRALVVHPVFSKGEATALAVNRLAAMQNEAGEWGDEYPFYQTMNALAHLDLPQADSQLEKAFGRLFECQNNDGTWSGSQPEWNTFLAVHALRNKGLL